MENKQRENLRMRLTTIAEAVEDDDPAVRAFGIKLLRQLIAEHADVERPGARKPRTARAGNEALARATERSAGLPEGTLTPASALDAADGRR